MPYSLTRWNSSLKWILYRTLPLSLFHSATVVYSTEAVRSTVHLRNLPKAVGFKQFFKHALPGGIGTITIAYLQGSFSPTATA